MFTTNVNETRVDNGADSIDYDSKGNVYTGLFDDGTLYKLTLKPDGTLASNESVKVSTPLVCVDGLIVDRKTDKMYLNDSRRNAIQTVDLPVGTVEIMV